MAQLVDPKHEWAGEIGRIVIAFGNIEHITMLCLNQLPNDPIYPATSHLNLAPRLELLVAVLRGSTDIAAEKLGQLLTEAKALAEERNLVVHNPLVLDVYQDSDGGYKFEHTIQSLRRVEKRLALRDLESIRERAERLATDLYEVASPMLERRYRAVTGSGDIEA
ncbi:hypothetical protein V0R48_06040 [Pseudomonas alcaligenes]|uniref:hypothetical protein n=1 Tax=Aquipseudomonas alcaligenes TaxID=43263 RepID=UPI002E7BFF8A|nr:hypothetical protein [Pseudomonas alcaligenes]MEE1948526.1 hypothetical protein [Pseudomonas alcaligenes]